VTTVARRKNGEIRQQPAGYCRRHGGDLAVLAAGLDDEHVAAVLAGDEEVLAGDGRAAVDRALQVEALGVDELAGLHDLGDLCPAAEAVSLVLDHGQDGALTRRG
jgi:hypothetical protein